MPLYGLYSKNTENIAFIDLYLIMRNPCTLRVSTPSDLKFSSEYLPTLRPLAKFHTLESINANLNLHLFCYRTNGKGYEKKLNYKLVDNLIPQHVCFIRFKISSFAWTLQQKQRSKYNENVRTRTLILSGVHFVKIREQIEQKPNYDIGNSTKLTTNDFSLKPKFFELLDARVQNIRVHQVELGQTAAIFDCRHV